MRDVGILVWVALVVIGVIGSMVSSLRRAGQGQAQPRPPGQPVQLREARLPDWARQVVAAMPQPPAATPRPAAPPPPPPPKPAPKLAPLPEHAGLPHQARRRHFFAGKSEIVRAVIAAEVLGKPRAFNDEYVGR
jgi:hypothetical protein